MVFIKPGAAVAQGINNDNLKMAIAERILGDPKFAEKINLVDDGSLLRDHELLLKLKAMEVEREQTTAKKEEDSAGDGEAGPRGCKRYKQADCT